MFPERQTIQPAKETALCGNPALMKLQKQKLTEFVRIATSSGLWSSAAAVSFHAMFAAIPLIAVLLTACARLLPSIEAGRNGRLWFSELSVYELESALQGFVPDESYDIIREEVQHMQTDPPFAMLVIGFLMSIWIASSAFHVILKTMDRIYEVKSRHPVWKIRLYALLLASGLSLFFAAALIFLVWTPEILELLGMQNLPVISSSVSWLALATLTLVSFESVYRVGPCLRPPGMPLTAGTIVGSILFMFCSIGLHLYVEHINDYNKLYGSLAGAMVLMLWLLLTNACLLLGCVVNRVLDGPSAETRERHAAESAHLVNMQK